MEIRYLKNTRVEVRKSVRERRGRGLEGERGSGTIVDDPLSLDFKGRLSVTN